MVTARRSRFQVTRAVGGADEKSRSRGGPGYKSASINRYLEALRRGYTLGKENVPPLVITAPKIVMLDESDNIREGFLLHEDYVKLRNELPDHQRLLLIIGYHLGMRKGEILNLRWEQVDWSEKLIRLERRQTKGRQARVAPLYGDLAASLEMRSLPAIRSARSSWPTKAQQSPKRSGLEECLQARRCSRPTDPRSQAHRGPQHGARWIPEKRPC